MNSKTTYTALGFLTLIIWGTSPAFTKILSSQLGGFTAAATVNILGGILVLLKQKFIDHQLTKFKNAPKRYWIVCGSLFIVYTASSYISMAIVHNTQAVVTLVLIRFLWPLFTLVFTIPVLKQKASPWLIAAIFVSLSGIVVAKLGDNIRSLGSLFQIFSQDVWAYVLCLVVAVSWGLYTNFTKKLLTHPESDGVGIFMLISGLILGAISLSMPEPRTFNIQIIWPLLYQSVIVACLANILWNQAILKGKLLLVVLASNFLPVISAVSSSLMLGIPLNVYIIAGSLLVIAGTYWSRWCFQRKEQHEI
jgi:drug/metabolite transporter (DMT)-like permease